jgi:hypothetical protein
MHKKYGWCYEEYFELEVVEGRGKLHKNELRLIIFAKHDYDYHL